ncbi:MAG: hypothetical protein L3J47_00095 [Sulfurovum sp.]|nr:hypothetical protein [Sulfurovum sp.]
MVDITGYRGTRKLIEIDSYSQTCAVIDYHVGEERILVVDSDRVSVPE